MIMMIIIIVIIVQWFQVNFGKWVKIARMSHQGRQDANQWIKKFTITYSYDGVFFYKYKKGGKIAVRKLEYA